MSLPETKSPTGQTCMSVCQNVFNEEDMIQQGYIYIYIYIAFAGGGGPITAFSCPGHTYNEAEHIQKTAAAWSPLLK